MKKVLGVAIAVVVPFVIAVGIVVLSGSDNQPETPEINESPGINEVFMLPGRYVPAELNIKLGETVKFINKDTEDHWPASDDHPTHQKYSELDPRKIIKPGGTWEFTFDEPGRWDMHDHIFPAIRSVVTVSSN